MKLIIQIPCYNEEESLPVALSQLPREVAGFDQVEWLVIDDGCTDRTVAVARSYGVDHVISHKTNLGLARAFMTGIKASLESGADIIINTDADNQYNADDIPVLVAPLFEGRAEIVVGERPVSRMPRFALFSRIMHAVGCFVVRIASGTDIPDAPSGFRAFTRSAAGRLKVYDSYTYTIETIIQAGCMKTAIISVPVRVNGKLRPSRLISSIPVYILRSALTIIRTFALYRPFHFFFALGLILIAKGVLFTFLPFGIRVLLAVVGGVCFIAPFVLELTPWRRLIHEEMKFRKQVA